jgi:flagellar FliL protein
MGLIKAIAFVSVIVVVEVVAASILIPSAQDTEELALKLAAAEAGKTLTGGDSGGESGLEDPEEDIREILLGNFNVTRYRPESGTTLTVDIEIYASMLAAEELEFVERFEKNRGRVGEQVVMTIHAVETTDLSDAELGLIKRQILEKTNRALGKPLVREVLFSKFNFVER